MSANGKEIVEKDTRDVGYTIPLTEAVENGAITPDDYARIREGLVGAGNIFEHVIIPLVSTLWRRVFPRGGSAQVKRRT